jgi:hypothetical protein
MVFVVFVVGGFGWVGSFRYRVTDCCDLYAFAV